MSIRLEYFYHFFFIDINECEDDLKVCLRNEKCVNEEGGYKCLDVNSRNNEINNNLVNNVPSTTPKISGPPSCPRGFKYNLTQNTCDGKKCVKF